MFGYHHVGARNDHQVLARHDAELQPWTASPSGRPPKRQRYCIAEFDDALDDTPLGRHTYRAVSGPRTGELHRNLAITCVPYSGAASYSAQLVSMVHQMSREKRQDLLHPHPAADRMLENPFVQQLGIASIDKALQLLATVIPTLTNLCQLQGRARQHFTSASRNFHSTIRTKDLLQECRSQLVADSDTMW